MKASKAMLKTYAKGVQQCHGPLREHDEKGKVCAVCAGVAAVRDGGAEPIEFERAFEAAWGITPVTLNDEDRIPWEHIYGMARAAGL